jgi:MFS family permease
MSDPKYPYQADYIAMDANYEEEINAKKLPLALLQDSKAITLDEALEMNKVGFYHYRILLLCGLAFMADALEVNLLSFLSTCAGAEWDLTDTQKASITGVVFAGIILGSGFWGIISDWYGRKIGFILATAIITFGGVLTGFATSYPLLLFFRGLVGFGLGGANVPFDLLAELLPSNQRGCFLIYIEFFWTIGSITVAGLAWAMLDSQGWRVLALLTVIPVGLSSLISIIYLPESPRWLLSVGRNAEAEKIVRDAAMINGIEMPEFRIKYEETEESKVDYLNIIKDPALRKITLPLWAAWAGFGFTYYGIILFVSRIYSTTNDDSTSCSFDYPSIFYNALSEIAGVTLSAMLVESIGRVNMQTIFYFFSGLTAILMGIAMPDSALVVVGIIGRIAIMVASVS